MKNEYNKFQDLVKIIPCLTFEECDYVLSEVKTYDDYHRSLVGNSIKDSKESEVRTSYTTTIHKDSKLDLFLRKKIKNSYHKWLKFIDEQYSDRHIKNFPSLIFENISVNRYTKDQYYNYHEDGVKNSNRIISCCLYINDEYDGGELEFPFVKIKPSKGDVIIFPSNQCYPHKSNSIANGIKYSVVTWLCYDKFEKKISLDEKLEKHFNDSIKLYKELKQYDVSLEQIESILFGKAKSVISNFENQNLNP